MEVVFSDIELIEPEKNKVTLKDKKTITYDYLVVATGSVIDPDEDSRFTGKLAQEYF